MGGHFGVSPVVSVGNEKRVPAEPTASLQTVGNSTLHLAPGNLDILAVVVTNVA